MAFLGSMASTSINIYIFSLKELVGSEVWKSHTHLKQLECGYESIAMW